MKKALAALLTALTLLTILPYASLPAKAEFDFNIDCSLSSAEAYVGETFYWYVYGETGSGNYMYSFDVYKDGVRYAPENPRLSVPWRDYTPPVPGKYKVVVLVEDTNNNEKVVKHSAEINVTANTNKIKKVEPLGPTRLKITWNKIPGATKYYLLRSTSLNTGWQYIAGIPGTSYTDANLTAGTRYFYKVEYERYGVSHSWYSPVVAGVPMGRTAITSIASPAKRQVKLAWSKTDGASGYQVLMANSSNGSYKPVRTLSGTTVTFTGFKSGSALFFKIRPYKRIYTTTCWGDYSMVRSVRVK